MGGPRPDSKGPGPAWFLGDTGRERRGPERLRRPRPADQAPVNDTAFDVFNGGGFDSVGAWWQSLDCRLRRVAAGDGNAEDAQSPYCAHYPGSGQSPLLGDMQRQHVDAVGMALLDLSDTGVYPPARDRIGQVNRVLLPAVSRAILSSTVNAVSDRVNSRLSSPNPPTARLNLGGASNTPVRSR